MDCYKIKNVLERSRKTLLWEYDFEFDKKIFDEENKFYSLYYDSSYECKCLLKTLYLYYIGFEKYQEGNFWGNTFLNNNERKVFFKCFKKTIEKFGLFNKIREDGHYQKTLILIHSVLSKHYSKNFLEIVKKIYDGEEDLEFFYYKYNQEQLLEDFKYSLKHFKELIKNKETFIIFKDLVYRVAKTLELLENSIYENKYNLPKWFFNEIKKFKDSDEYLYSRVRRDNFGFLNDGKVKVSFELDESVYFFDEDRFLIRYEEESKNEETIIYLSKNPKYIIVNKDLENWIEEMEDYFSSINRRWDVECGEYYCYELENELIDEEIDGYFFKEFIDIEKEEIELFPLKEEYFPKFLKAKDGSDVFFDGFVIKNFNDFNAVVLVNDENEEKLSSHEVNKKGKFVLKAIASLGREVKDKKVVVLQFKKIKLNEEKRTILVDDEIYNFGEKIEIEGVDFELDWLDIKIVNKNSNQTDIVLFREIKNYEIKIEHLPNFLKRAKIIYKDNNGSIIDKTYIKKNEKIINFSNEIKENLNFPIKIYIEYSKNKKPLLIGTIYKTEIYDNYKDAIEITPKLDRFKVVIQSRENIFAKPLKTSSHKIFYNEFPEPKKGDFSIIVYDNLFNKKITSEIVTIDRLKTEDKLIKYFQDPNILHPPTIKNKYVKNILKNIEFINYHFLEEDLQYKLNEFLQVLNESFKSEIDIFISHIHNNYKKLRYLILFNKNFEIYDFPIGNLSEETKLTIISRFQNRLTTIKNEKILEQFINIVNKNELHDRVKIFETLDLFEIGNIIEKSKIKVL
ncbi:hypothetical protein [Caminibacter sp.]